MQRFPRVVPTKAGSTQVSWSTGASGVMPSAPWGGFGWSGFSLGLVSRCLCLWVRMGSTPHPVILCLPLEPLISSIHRNSPSCSCPRHQNQATPETLLLHPQQNASPSDLKFPAPDFTFCPLKLLLPGQPMLHPSGPLFVSQSSGCPCGVGLAGYRGAAQDGWAGGDACNGRAAGAIICHIVLSLVFKNKNSSTDS